MRRAIATGALGAALVVSGILFGLPSLYMPGLALALLATGAAAWTALAARRASLSLRLPRGTVSEDGLVAPTVRAALPGGAPWAELEVPPMGGPLRMGAGVQEPRLEGPAGRRGRQAIGPARLRIRDPLGLAEREVLARAVEVLVLPRVEPIRIVAGTGRSGHAGRRGDGPEVELESLRAHRPGAPASRIHWPTVARTGELMERRLVADGESDPLVVLDATASPEEEEALDRAVRAAASLCLALARAGGCRVLLPGDRRPAHVHRDLRAWSAIHARLALVEATAESQRVARLPGAAAVFWVAAARRAPRGALLRAPARERWLVTPLAREDADAPLRVAGCGGRRLDRSRHRVRPSAPAPAPRVLQEGVLP